MSANSTFTEQNRNNIRLNYTLSYFIHIFKSVNQLNAYLYIKKGLFINDVSIAKTVW